MRYLFRAEFAPTWKYSQGSLLIKLPHKFYEINDTWHYVY